MDNIVFSSVITSVEFDCQKLDSSKSFVRINLSRRNCGKTLDNDGKVTKCFSILVNKPEFFSALEESGKGWFINTLRKTHEDFFFFFYGCEIGFVGVPYAKGQKEFVHPITNEKFVNEKPAQNNGVSYYIERIKFTKESEADLMELRKELKQGIAKEKEAIRQATANWLQSLLS